MSIIDFLSISFRGGITNSLTLDFIWFPLLILLVIGFLIFYQKKNLFFIPILLIELMFLFKVFFPFSRLFLPGNISVPSWNCGRTHYWNWHSFTFCFFICTWRNGYPFNILHFWKSLYKTVLQKICFD